MPLPTLEVGPWHHSSNIATGGVDRLQDHQETLLAVKNAMIGGTGCPNPWTVAGSGDGTTGAMDATDRWSVIGDLVWGVGAAPPAAVSHGWMVLQDVTGAQILLSCRTLSVWYTGRFMVISYSPTGGYTGGSGTLDPTAADEIEMSAYNTAWLATQTVAAVYKTHVMQSNDGNHTWIFFCWNNFCTSRWFLSKALDPVTGWTAPHIANMPNTVLGSETYGPTYTQLYSSQTYTRGRSSAGGSALNFYLTSEGLVNEAIGEFFSVANEISGEHALTPMGLACNNIGFRGRHGRIPDIWYTTDELPTGTTFPSDTSRQFAKFGDVVVPWDGSIPLIA